MVGSIIIYEVCDLVGAVALSTTCAAAGLTPDAMVSHLLEERFANLGALLVFQILEKRLLVLLA